MKFLSKYIICFNLIFMGVIIHPSFLTKRLSISGTTVCAARRVTMLWGHLASKQTLLSSAARHNTTHTIVTQGNASYEKSLKEAASKRIEDAKKLVALRIGAEVEIANALNTPIGSNLASNIRSEIEILAYRKARSERLSRQATEQEALQHTIDMQTKSEPPASLVNAAPNDYQAAQTQQSIAQESPDKESVK